MASTKRNGDTARTRTSAPISAHPAFPAIVALWFAALFGLGSMVLPTALPERAVALTGLDTIVPALAPPLGIGARTLIALAMTVIGVVLGLAVARKAASTPTFEPETARVRENRGNEAAGSARRPISALEELGDDLDHISRHAPVRDQAPHGRRRQLAVMDEDTGPWVPDVPLPGTEPDTVRAGPPPTAAPETLATETPADEPAPLELETFADIPAVALPDPVQSFVRPEAARFVAPAVEPAPTFGQPLPETSAAPRPFEMPAPASVPAPVPTDAANRPLAELGVVELIERLALAMRNSQARAMLRPGTGGAGNGQRDLAMRAAEALSRFPAEPDGQVEKDGESGPIITRPGEPPFPTIPSALRPLVFEAIDGEDIAVELPSFALRHESGMRDAVPFTAPVPAFGPPVEDEADAGDGEEDGIDEAEGYSSLLKLSAPSARSSEFVRIDEPEPECSAIQPVVVFPGQEMRRSAPDVPPPPSAVRPFDAPGAEVPSFIPPAVPAADPGETERALRVALANLQRISGAA